MNQFYEWVNKLGYNKEELINNPTLRKVLLDEYADLELFHLEQVNESRGLTA